MLHLVKKCLRYKGLKIKYLHDVQKFRISVRCTIRAFYNCMTTNLSERRIIKSYSLSCVNKNKYHYYCNYSSNYNIHYNEKKKKKNLNIQT